MTCPNCASMQAHYDALLEKYHDVIKETLTMKREGFSVPRPEGEPIQAPELPLAIRSAISQVSEAGSGNWRHLTKLAWDQHRNGVEEAQIAADILAGEQEPW